MARLCLTISAHATPAYYELLNAAQAIALSHGEEVAIAWAQAVLSRDMDFFISMKSDSRPELRVIEGGKP
jgi:hypothetical protein